LIEVVFAAGVDHVDRMELQPVRARSGFGVRDFGLTEGIVGVDKIADHRGRRNQLAQQIEPFARYRRGEKAHARDVAARPVEARDEA
jgi:hypothetical protein